MFLSVCDNNFSGESQNLRMAGKLNDCNTHVIPVGFRIVVGKKYQITDGLFNTGISGLRRGMNRMKINADIEAWKIFHQPFSDL